jgi:hypothetical protein
MRIQEHSRTVRAQDDDRAERIIQVNTWLICIFQDSIVTHRFPFNVSGTVARARGTRD